MKKENFDKYGMIIAGGDGGDSCANGGTYYFCHQVYKIKNWAKDLPYFTDKDYMKTAKLLEIFPGKWRRHPDPKRWYGLAPEYGGFYGIEYQSRDQQRAMNCCLAIRQDKARLKDFVYEQIKSKRILFMPNIRHNHQYPTRKLQEKLGNPRDEWNYEWKLPDILGPKDIAVVLRGFNVNVFGKLAILICDLHLLIDSIIKSKWPGNYDHRNHILPCCLSKYRHDNFIARLARKIYKPMAKKAAKIWWTRHLEPPMHEVLMPVIEDAM